MKKLLLLSVVFICLGLDATAQEEFDNKLSAVSNDIATKLNNKGIKTVAVSTFTNLDGQVTHLGKYIAEEFSVNLSNSSGSFALMDRNHLQQILAEHKLKSDGLIDPATAKELGKWVNVDAIVIGTIEVLTEKVRLVVKVLDIKTTFIIGASRGDLPMTPSIIKIINSSSSTPEITKPVEPTPGTGGGTQASKNKNCQAADTGDICFQNNTNREYNVVIVLDLNKEYDIVWGGTNNKYINLKSGEKKYFYDLKSGSHSYMVSEPVISGYPKPYTYGAIYIEQCQSKTFDIK
ncbi:MAG: FlgO family outer membrane protein [Spirosomataceae bacterium]